VRKFAEAHGPRCEIRKVNVAALARKKKLSVETAARNARRDFFLRLAKKHRCGAVFLAHHAEDQAETVLQHFFRGSALHGVSGMPPVAALGKSLLLVRPALEASRRDIDEYIAAFALEYREDASNASLEFTRNRVRHELLPLLDDIFRREVSPLITRFAEHARLDEDLARSLAERFVDGEKSIDADGSLEISARFRELHPALQGRILRSWLTARSGRIGSREIQAALAMLKPGAARTFSLPGGVHLKHDGRRFWLEPPAKPTRRKPKSPRSSKRR
jgi:tRNA(Ile)-lysidine synthase